MEKKKVTREEILIHILKLVGVDQVKVDQIKEVKAVKTKEDLVDTMH